MKNDIEREEALNEIRKNIAERGYHTYGVVGDACPHYGYTIGLTESLGAELVLAGGYFYLLDEVSEIIDGVVGKLRQDRKLRQPASWESKRIKCAPKGTFSLRRVHMTWAKALMLGVFDYYQVKKIQAYQIVPDKAHWTIEIPDMTKPWSPKLAPAWRWLQEEWTYPVPIDSVALSDLGALRGRRITEVMRWEKDQWEMFAGAGPDIPEEERRVVMLGSLLAADESLRPAVDLRVETGLWRGKDESEWHPWGKRRR
jgi:hypothetical protein